MSRKKKDLACNDKEEEFKSQEKGKIWLVVMNKNGINVTKKERSGM